MTKKYILFTCALLCMIIKADSSDHQQRSGSVKKADISWTSSHFIIQHGINEHYRRKNSKKKDTYPDRKDRSMVHDVELQGDHIKHIHITDVQHNLHTKTETPKTGLKHTLHISKEPRDTLSQTRTENYLPENSEDDTKIRLEDEKEKINGPYSSTKTEHVLGNSEEGIRVEDHVDAVTVRNYGVYHISNNEGNKEMPIYNNRPVDAKNENIEKSVNIRDETDRELGKKTKVLEVKNDRPYHMIDQGATVRKTRDVKHPNSESSDKLKKFEDSTTKKGYQVTRMETGRLDKDVKIYNKGTEKENEDVRLFNGMYMGNKGKDDEHKFVQKSQMRKLSLENKEEHLPYTGNRENNFYGQDLTGAKFTDRNNQPVNFANQDDLNGNLLNKDIKDSIQHSNMSLSGKFQEKAEQESKGNLQSTVHSLLKMTAKKNPTEKASDREHTTNTYVTTHKSMQEIVPVTSKQVPIVPVTSKQVPIVPVTTKQVPFVPVTSKQVPIVPVTSKQVPIVPVTSKKVPIVPVTTKQVPIVPVTSKQIPIVPVTSKQVPIVPVTSKKVPVVDVDNDMQNDGKNTHKENTNSKLIEKHKPGVTLLGNKDEPVQRLDEEIKTTKQITEEDKKKDKESNDEKDKMFHQKITPVDLQMYNNKPVQSNDGTVHAVDLTGKYSKGGKLHEKENIGGNLHETKYSSVAMTPKQNKTNKLFHVNEDSRGTLIDEGDFNVKSKPVGQESLHGRIVINTYNKNKGIQLQTDDHDHDSLVGAGERTLDLIIDDRTGFKLMDSDHNHQSADPNGKDVHILGTTSNVDKDPVNTVHKEDKFNKSQNMTNKSGGNLYLTGYVSTDNRVLSLASTHEHINGKLIVKVGTDANLPNKEDEKEGTGKLLDKGNVHDKIFSTVDTLTDPNLDGKDLLVSSTGNLTGKMEPNSIFDPGEELAAKSGGKQEVTGETEDDTKGKSGNFLKKKDILVNEEKIFNILKSPIGILIAVVVFAVAVVIIAGVIQRKYCSRSKNNGYHQLPWDVDVEDIEMHPQFKII